MYPGPIVGIAHVLTVELYTYNNTLWEKGFLCPVARYNCITFILFLT